MRAPEASVLAAFTIAGPVAVLPGGEGRTVRAGDIVLRREHPEDIEQAAWLADLFSAITPAGFRVPRPLQTADGAWIAPGGWTAWTFLHGQPATAADAPAVARAIESFHAALVAVPRPPHLDRRDSPYDRADRWAWGSLPARVDPPFDDLVTRLAAVRRPLPDLPEQLIHGDLNPENVLIAPGGPPAIIDMAPYWRPAPFASAVAAYWLGPYRGDAGILRVFADVPHLDQMLVRAGLRMLLSAWQFSHTRDIDRYREATAIIVRGCL